MGQQQQQQQQPEAVRQGSATVVRFADRDRALEHLCDHVLTAPECEAWARILPEFVAWLLTDSERRFKLARQIWRQPSPPEEVELLLAAYLEEIQLAIEQAQALGWWWPSGEDRVYFGLNGLRVVVGKDVVRSAYLPGFGDALSTAAARQEALSAEQRRARRRHDPLPRERGSRQGQPEEQGARARRCERSARTRGHESSRAVRLQAGTPPREGSTELQARFLIYRRAAQRVRTELVAVLRRSPDGEQGASLLRATIRSLEVWQQLVQRHDVRNRGEDL